MADHGNRVALSNAIRLRRRCAAVSGCLVLEFGPDNDHIYHLHSLRLYEMHIYIYIYVEYLCVCVTG